MLKKSSKILLEGTSVIADQIVARFVATIDADDPTSMNITTRLINADAYKENLAIVQADQKEFEDHAYATLEKVLNSAE